MQVLPDKEKVSLPICPFTSPAFGRLFFSEGNIRHLMPINLVSSLDLKVHRSTRDSNETLETIYHDLPVVPHKAVAEVSK